LISEKAVMGGKKWRKIKINAPGWHLQVREGGVRAWKAWMGCGDKCGGQMSQYGASICKKVWVEAENH
jgi:hypothetical protein